MNALVRFLLRLHPRAFREAREEEILNFVEEELRRSTGQAWIRRTATRVRILLDLCKSAIRTRWVPLGSHDPASGSERRPGSAWGSWMQDLRFGLRSAFASPMVTGVVILTLGLGVGMNTAIFSVVNGVLLRPLEYERPNELIEIDVRFLSVEDAPNRLLSIVAIEELHSRIEAIEAVAPVAQIRQNLSGVGLPSQVVVGWTDHRFFPLLGVDAALGRTFADDDPPGTVVLSDEIWRERFGADPDVIGSGLRLDGNAYTVVGVLPPGYRTHVRAFPEPDLWKNPDNFWQNGDVWGSPNLTTPFFQALARVRAGADRPTLERDLRAVAADFRTRSPGFEREGLDLVPRPLHEQVVGHIRPTLLMLTGAVALVLLIACANVAGLLLVRAQNRTREMVLRLALGSSRWRIARLLMAESLVLAILAGGAGVLVGSLGTPLLLRAGPDIPRAEAISIDPAVLGFTLFVSVLCTFIVGIAPAWAATRHDGATVLRSGRGAVSGRSRFRGALVVTQIALSLVLLIGAGLLTNSLLRLQSVDPGFEPDGLLTFSVSIPGTQYSWPEDSDRFFREVESGLMAIPQIRSAGVMWPIPLTGDEWQLTYEAGDLIEEEERVYGDFHIGTEAYFDAMGIDVLEGRLFEPSDPREVVVVNRTLAERAWPGENISGRTLRANPWGPEPSEFRIIGVIDDVRLRGLDQAAVPPALYFDTRGWSYTDWEFNVVARVDGDPESVIPSVREVVQSLDSEVPVAEAAPYSALVDRVLAPIHFALTLVGLFTAVAVTLSVVGLYGIVSYSVSRRTPEIGVRMALGSARIEVTRLMLSEGARLAAIGIVAGLIGAAFVTQLLSAYLYEVAPTDPLTFTALAVLMGVLALAATWIPARRASRVDPVRALRSE